MKIDFFTSDHHFDHEAVISYSDRPYSCVDEMNRDLIARHNSVVKPDDTVCFVGDFTLRPSILPEIVPQLNGHKILVRGNHDKPKDIDRYLAAGFESAHEKLWLLVGDTTYVIQHIPAPWFYTEDKRARRPGEVIVHGHCLPAEYEVLTRDGWKSIKKCYERMPDCVLGYENGVNTWSSCFDVVQYAGPHEMIRCSHPALPALMTKKHHVYTRDGGYIPLDQALDSVRGVDLVHCSEGATAGPGVALSDDEIRLIVAFCADGTYDKGNHTNKNGYRRVRFRLKKPRKIARLERILEGCGFSYRSQMYGDGIYRLTLEQDGQKFLERWVGLSKRLPPWFRNLDCRQVGVVIDELTMWDGWASGGRSMQFVSIKREEIDLVQELLTMAGILSRTYNNRKVVGWQKSRQNRGKKLLRHWCSYETIQTPVGCLTTSTKNFWCRTAEGKVFLSGNTHQTDICTPGHVHVGVDAHDYYPCAAELVYTIF